MLATYTHIPSCNQCGAWCGSNPALWPEELPLSDADAQFFIERMKVCNVATITAYIKQCGAQQDLPADIQAQMQRSHTWPEFKALCLQTRSRHICPACGRFAHELHGCDEHDFSHLSDADRHQLRAQIELNTGIAGAGRHAYQPTHHYGCYICTECITEYRRSFNDMVAGIVSAHPYLCPLMLLCPSGKFAEVCFTHVSQIDQYTLKTQWVQQRGESVAEYRFRLTLTQ